jgi:hypothetical protein
MNTVEELTRYLIKHYPELNEYFDAYEEEMSQKPKSEYAIFSSVVKPYIDDLYINAMDEKLSLIWKTLEYIALNWGDPAKNDLLLVTTEEIELHKHYKYLGPKLKEAWITSITWIPYLNWKQMPLNQRIDQVAYKERWIDEIEKIGGFDNLDTNEESRIFNALKQEFGILTNLNASKLNAIGDLISKYIQFEFEFAPIEKCIKWAEDRILESEEYHDQDIILLAGSIDQKEAEDYVQAILKKYTGTSDITKDECVCGQYIVKLYERYKNNKITVDDLEPILSKLYNNLEYPDWLVMLSRNCEYATDVYNYIDPFEQEFDYIANLWRSSESLNDFKSKYSRDKSNTHDIKK